MTAATVSSRFQPEGIPGCEMVELSAASGETFVSRFSNVTNVQATAGSAPIVDFGVAAVNSSGTITIHHAETGDETIYLQVWGR